MEIKKDGLLDGEVLGLLGEHLADMYATSPPESVHALDVDGLRSSSITFFSAWCDNTLKGCVAIKELSPTHAEIKSMRTSAHARQQGIATALIQHVIGVAEQRGYEKLSLETGSVEFFHPARKLYEKFGFNYCGPFEQYRPDPNSKFMSLSLKPLVPTREDE